MYCPRCAAQNADDTKYCRACGINLQVVSQALADPDKLGITPAGQAKNWLARRREGISTLIKGTGLIGASLLVGVALGLFSNTNDWIFVWLGLASWMACWGVILWSQGINALIESRFLRREFGLPSREATTRATQELEASEQVMLPESHPDASASTKLARPPSVTEHTTELLNE